jgi:hypothetical protein
MALLGCGSVPQEVSTPATQPPMLAAQKPEWSKLTRDVERAYWALQPTVGAQVAFNVQNNRLLIDALRPCMEERGFKIREFEVTHDSLADTGAARNPNGVDARWPNPPDLPSAKNGLGHAGSLNAQYGAEVTDGEPAVPVDEAGNVDEAAIAAYGQAYDACSAKLGAEPKSFDSTEMVGLLGEFDTIGRETEAMVGFDAIRAEYKACVDAAGFDFETPNVLLELAEDSYRKMVFEEAQAFERAISTTDALCREPLYDRIITLNAKGWQAWLDANSERINRVEADLTRLALSED